MSIDVQRLRAEFPTLQHKAYINSGSYGLLAIEVQQAFERYLADRLECGADWGKWVQLYEDVRQRVALLLGASTDEIAVTASASAGLNALASALSFTDGRDKIVVSDFEFPTSGQIWHAQERAGARVEHVPENAQGYIPLEAFERAIDERTRLVAISHVCYRNGARLDVAEITRMARRKGALVLLDCFQSVGVMQVDVKALDVDFAVGGMLKYLLGTAGIGFLYVREGCIPQLTPKASGWFAQADVDAMDVSRNVPSPTARRFQAGTPPVPNCYAALAGLDIILQLGSTAIETYVRELTGRCMDRLLEAGCRLATPREDSRRGPTVAICSSNDVELTARLAERNVITSCRDGNLRAMFHAYNDESDVDALVEGLLANRALV
ncbi:MAG TPA: aminotransferase class V-fold PLP-dependent enzyme, partial [Steroidobacteraceae bacterium]|nr:aminotransferase class V-fold PLP-dependent enzyme [Steroidobacteraceae bacterium]